MNGITADKCRNCGHVMYPRHLRCLHCGGREFEAIEPGRQGKLVTFTEVHSLPWGIDERTRAIGIVELDGGVRALGQIKAREPSIGMSLKAGWGPVRVVAGEEVYGLVFEPAE